MTKAEFFQLITYLNEERHIEFKENSPWENESKGRVTRSIIAMSNLRDGGWIIFGKKLKKDHTYENIGLSQDTFDSFISDNIKDYVYSHAQPPIELELFKEEVDGKKYAGLKIQGLGEMPHICSKQEDKILEPGKIYIRSLGKPETTEIRNYIEMQEVLEICTEKSLSNYLIKMERIGIDLSLLQIKKSVDDKYGVEAKDIL